MKKQRRLSREAFELFLLGITGTPGGRGSLPLYVKAPFAIRECFCRDVNCHGWRLVQVQQNDDDVQARGPALGDPHAGNYRVHRSGVI